MMHPWGCSLVQSREKTTLDCQRHHFSCSLLPAYLTRRPLSVFLCSCLHFDICCICIRWSETPPRKKKTTKTKSHLKVLGETGVQNLLFIVVTYFNMRKTEQYSAYTDLPSNVLKRMRGWTRRRSLWWVRGPWGVMETKKETLLSISSKSIRSQSLLMGHWVVEGVWNPGAWEEIQARGDRGIDE